MAGRHLAYLLPVVLYAAVVTWLPPAVALLEPDSDSYLQMSAVRTLGYPLFVSTLGRTGLAVESIPYAQLAIFCVGLAFLGWSTERATRRPIGAALLVVAIAANPFVAEYHFTILTESLFMTLTMAIIGLLALYLRSPGWPMLALAGLVMGLAVTVRPLGYAFLPLLPLAVLLAPGTDLRERGRDLGAGLLAALAMVSIESWQYHAHFGPERRSLAPAHLFAKAALVDTRAANPYPPEDHRHGIWRALTEDVEDVRTLIREAPSLGAAAHLLSSYEIFFQYRYARERLDQAAAAMGNSTDAVQREVAWGVLAGARASYAALTARELARMWTVFAATHPREAERLAGYLDERRPLPLAAAGGALDEPIAPRRLALLAQPAIQAAGLVGIVLIAIVIGRKARRLRVSTALATAALLALMVNGNFLLVALTAIAQPRYTLAMWPGIAAYCCFAGIAALDRLRDGGSLMTSKSTRALRR